MFYFWKRESNVLIASCPASSPSHVLGIVPIGLMNQEKKDRRGPRFAAPSGEMGAGWLAGRFANRPGLALSQFGGKNSQQFVKPALLAG